MIEWQPLSKTVGVNAFDSEGDLILAVRVHYQDVADLEWFLQGHGYSVEVLPVTDGTTYKKSNPNASWNLPK